MNDRLDEWQLHPIVKDIVSWYEANGRMLPWRADCDPYHIWVSEIMLQQTRIEAVIPYYDRFMKRLPTIHDLANCEDEELHKLWEGLGYYSRVRNLKKGAVLICEKYGGVFPKEYDQIRDIPGIGDYTAGAIASMAFSQKKAAVDGNVLRVLTRLMACDHDIMDLKFRKEVAAKLESVYPSGQEAALTQGLMELGEVVCIPNGEAKCDSCPVRAYCKAWQLRLTDTLPVKKPKAARRMEDKAVYRFHSDGKIAIRRRASQGLLAGLWEYPNSEETDSCMLASIFHSYGLELGHAEEKKHIFTHVEWHMQCYDVDIHLPREEFEELLGRIGVEADLVWVTPQELEAVYTLPTAFRKLW